MLRDLAKYWLMVGGVRSVRNAVSPVLVGDRQITSGV